MSETQAVIFFKPKWNISKSKKWLKDNMIRPLTLSDGSEKKPDTKLFKGQIRYRITDPKQYRRFTTQVLDSTESGADSDAKGIHLILGWKGKFDFKKMKKKVIFRPPKKKKLIRKQKK